MIDLSKYNLHNNSSNILIVANENYFSNYDCLEIEIIATNEVPCFRFISKEDFINKVKKPFYYKYKTVIVEEQYLSLLKNLKFYFEDKNFILFIILNKTYSIETDDILVDYLKNKDYYTEIIEDNNNIFMRITK